MRSFLATFGAALLTATVLTPLIRAAALRMNAVAVPGERHLHGTKIPRLGGIGIALAFTAPITALFLIGKGSVAQQLAPDLKQIWTIVLGGLLMAGIGAADDIRGLRARYKLMGQLVIASLTCVAGIEISQIHLPFVGNLSMGIFGCLVTIFWIVGITNAINLIDGLDGLAAGVAFFAALTNLAVALLHGQIFMALMMSALMGSLVGFLFFNFNPARIFMGDSGSYFLGYVLATASIVTTSQKTTTAVSILIPLVALGVPIVDTAHAMLRRAIERRSLFSPDRGHIHHRLLAKGLSHRGTVLVLYLLCVCMTLGAIAMSLGRDPITGLVLMAILFVLLGVTRLTGGFDQVRSRTKQKERIRDERTQLLRAVVPGVLDDLAHPESFSHLSTTLKIFLTRSRFCAAEFLTPDDTSELVIEAHSPPDEARDLVTARFPLGPGAEAHMHLKFVWRDPAESVPASVDILLQLVADAVSAGLIQLHHNWAPTVSRSIAPRIEP